MLGDSILILASGVHPFEMGGFDRFNISARGEIRTSTVCSLLIVRTTGNSFTFHYISGTKWDRETPVPCPITLTESSCLLFDTVAAAANK